MKQLIIAVFALFAIGLTTSCERANANQAGFTSNSGTVESNEKESILNAYKVGEVVDDFSLKNVNGNMVSMADFEDADGYIIIFTTNSCPYSQMYEDRIIALDKKYSPKGWPVIAINPNDPTVSEEDSFELMQVRAKEKGFTFPYLFDAGQKVYPKWGAARTPHVFIVNKTEAGNTLEYIGAIDDNARNAESVTVNYVDKTIAAIEAGETPSPRTTKAIGCTIKTK